MDELGFNLECLKTSAFAKYQKICQDNLNNAKIIPHNQERKTTSVEKSKKWERNTGPKKSSSTSPRLRSILENLEAEKKNAIRQRLQSRLRIMEDFSKQQEEEKREQGLQLQQNILQVRLKEENTISQLMNECDRRNDNEHAKLASMYRKHRQVQEKLEADRQRQNRNLEKLKKAQQEFRLVYEQILLLLKKYGDEMKTYLGDDLKVLTNLREQFEETLKQCKKSSATEEEVNKACNLHNLTTLRTKIESYAEKIIKTKQQQIQEKQPVAVETPVTLPSSSIVDSTSKQKYLEKNVPDVSSISRFINLTNLKMYVEIMEFLDKHSATFKELVNDPNLKQFKFDCKKAVNLPVNSLSGVNSEHIQDKYNRLYRLLKGHDTIVGEKSINASKHPQGVAFCTDLLAKKFVLQGDLMVSSNPESAFCYATVAVSLWNDFPIFGKLLLGYFYKNCPYLVPYYIPREVGESDEEFYTKQGYQYIDGKIEKQDKFLKRMTGIMRLYAAVMIVKPKKGQIKNPYDLSRGWAWISSILKLDPHIDITATMLHAFLETAGFEMQAKYGKIFHKLVRKGIIDSFLPNLREKCTGGAVTRLELLLNDYFKNGGFQQPDGYMRNSYW